MAAVTVVSSQPFYLYLKISLNNINFYTVPPKKPKIFQYYAITVSKVNISNIFKKRKIKKGRVPRFPLIDNSMKYLNQLREGKLFHIAFFKYST